MGLTFRLLRVREVACTLCKRMSTHCKLVEQGVSVWIVYAVKSTLCDHPRGAAFIARRHSQIGIASVAPRVRQLFS